MASPIENVRKIVYKYAPRIALATGLLGGTAGCVNSDQFNNAMSTQSAAIGEVNDSVKGASQAIGTQGEQIASLQVQSAAQATKDAQSIDDINDQLQEMRNTPTATATNTATVAPSATATGTPVPTDAATATQVATVQATKAAAENRPTFKFTWKDADKTTPAEVSKVEGDIWSIDGLPTKVDANNVLVAKGKFVNKIGLGSQFWLAEPGTILVGPEFPQAKVDAANGAIERISPVTQQLITANEQSVPVDEDRFSFSTFGSAKLEINGVTIDLQYKKGHVWGLIVRGLFPDGLQDTDRNHTLLFHEVPAGHVQVMNYPQNKGGFISEENFQQVREAAYIDRNNCGAEGCSTMDVVFLDLNTGAFTIIKQGAPNTQWEFVASNWKMTDKIDNAVLATITKTMAQTLTPTPNK